MCRLFTWHKKIPYFLDPPSPNTISMLSADPFNEGGRITPFSLLSTGICLESPSAMTPLALFTKSIRENLPLGKVYTGSCDIVIKRKVSHAFIFPVEEVDEMAEMSDNSVHCNPQISSSICEREIENQPICQNMVWQNEDRMKCKPRSRVNSVEPCAISSVPSIGENPISWPFAGLPPSSPKHQNTSRIEQSISDAWPFANKPPGIAYASLKPPSPTVSSLNPISLNLSPIDSDVHASFDDKKRVRGYPIPSPLIIQVSSLSQGESTGPASPSIHSPQDPCVSRCSNHSKGSSSLHLDSQNKKRPTPDLSRPSSGLPRRCTTYTPNRLSPIRTQHSSLSNYSVRNGRTSALDIIYPQVNIEPLPFDVGSLYSAKSMLSVVTRTRVLPMDANKLQASPDT